MKKWIVLLVTTLVMSGCSQDGNVTPPSDMISKEAVISSSIPIEIPPEESVVTPESDSVPLENLNEEPTPLAPVDKEALQIALDEINNDIFKWENYVFDYTILDEEEPEVALAEAFAEKSVETWLDGRVRSNLSNDENDQLQEVYINAWDNYFTFDQRLELEKRYCAKGFQSQELSEREVK